LITGITGQDGSFLSEQLIELGWTVVGVMRRSASPDLWRVAHLDGRLVLEHGDLLDMGSLVRLLHKHRPDHIYNLAAQSFVPTSWEQPVLTGQVTALGCARMLEAMRIAAPEARFYQAGSSEMFGSSGVDLQDEGTPFHPRSPYGVAKTYAHHLTVNYRESYGLFAVGGILFNHESERRGLEFVTRKISMAVARIHRGQQKTVKLGRMDVRRDWGFAGDYTRAIHGMLMLDTPDDFVIATGECWSVEDFCSRAFACVDLNWRDHVQHDPDLLRPAEIVSLRGNPAKAKAALGWEPLVGFDDLVERMVRCDVDRLA
jgi:GDPmannose 4,6-dehydratase